ncbi:MAG: flagellar biosynthesis anti-sigma factor FlgM [Actinomycetota bacterium]|nr:flagellar biosynthesis anti-sigma factor FlgM [Actinomycetota bacterium]
MKISNEQVKQVLDKYVRQVENKTSDRAKGSEQKTEKLRHNVDSVTITARGEEANKAREAYRKLPEVRKDLVDEIKTKIKSGDYEVTSKDVADKIVHRMIIDKMV